MLNYPLADASNALKCVIYAAQSVSMIANRKFDEAFKKIKGPGGLLQIPPDVIHEDSVSEDEYVHLARKPRHI